MCLLLWLSLTLLSCAAPTAPPQEQNVPILRVAGWPIPGQTLCRGPAPVIVVQAELPDSIADGTIIHELVHVRQMAENGGCLRASLRYQEDPVFRFTQEVEAYCPQLDYWVKRGWVKRKETREKLLQYLHAQLAPELDIQQAAALFVRACPA